MANVVTASLVEVGLVYLKTWLGNWRQVVIAFDTRATDSVAIGIWARDRHEKVLHCWPGPHLREDFFTGQEEAILRWGCIEVMETIAARTKNAPLGLQLYDQACSALREVLSIAANGWGKEEDAAA